MRYWLMKSEPNTYSIDQFAKDGTTLWDGIRNYQARNFMIRDMEVEDLLLFYHSNTNPPGVAGLGKVVRKASADPSALNAKSPYYDPKATKEKPIWECVKVGFLAKAATFCPLHTLREDKSLDGMLLFQKGQRLSIQPVEAKHFKKICKLGGLPLANSGQKPR